MKLKNVQAYKISDVPDHLTHECSLVGMEIMQLVMEKFGDRDPNILLGAFTFAHAALIKYFISETEGELEKAANLYAIGLIKNVKFLSDLIGDGHREV